MEETIIKYIIITTARNEEQYLDEWIQYHLKLGFTHIYICDNNDIPLCYNHENVTVYHVNDIDFSESIYQGQCKSYNRILNEIQYDYCCIIDVDEFLEFKTCKNIQEFVNSYVDDVVDIPWEIYDDNDLIFHIDKPVRELYPNIQNKMNWDYENNECSWSKSIFKKSNDICPNPHHPNHKRNLIDKSIAVVKHYRTKCLEDYIKNKCLTQNANTAPFTNGNIIQTYFSINNINLDKLMWALRFCKDCNYQISTSDRFWILNQFENFYPITIVIRTYNRLSLLKECIKSFDKQTRKCKLLILNDGSTDNTSEWLSAQNFDYLSLKTNVGPGEILTRGKHLITTPYYIMFDDDDEWTSSHVVEFLYNSIIDNPYMDLLLSPVIYHTTHLVSTDLLLKCPNISLFKLDDHYMCWIKNNAKIIIKHNFDFYNYRSNIEAEYHVNNTISNTPILSFSFYNQQDLDFLKNYIINNYYLYSVQERKACDQMLKYINNLN